MFYVYIFLQFVIIDNDDDDDVVLVVHAA